MARINRRTKSGCHFILDTENKNDDFLMVKGNSTFLREARCYLSCSETKVLYRMLKKVFEPEGKGNVK